MLSTIYLFIILFVMVILLGCLIMEVLKIRKTLQSIADRSTGETVPPPRT